ncbi:uncharacterized protein [Antennarius striatus]|uniref:uncharacterized protein n=1 Tax=Antennarius striatus TaxID=241820 RepID=UPI0035B43A6E
MICGRQSVNQTSLVDVSLVDTATTTNCTISVPSPESRTPILISVSETDSEVGGSPDSSVSVEPPSMFSTSMAPPHPTPSGQEEELITTFVPTVKEAHEDTDDVTPFSVDDFLSENVTNEAFVPQRGDTFPESKHTTEPSGTTESLSEPTEEPDDQAVFEINTIQPDVPMLDVSLITEPMFAVGKTEETILDSVITAGITSDLTDMPTESTELPGEEAFISESTSFADEVHSTTPFPDYDFNLDGIETDFGVEAVPSAYPYDQDLSSSSPEWSIMEGTALIPTETTFMCNTQPGNEMDVTTTSPPEITVIEKQTIPQTVGIETAAVDSEKATLTTTVLIDGGVSDEDVVLSPGVHVFDESTIQFPEDSDDTLTERPEAEIDSEFFTSSSVASAEAQGTTPAVAADLEQSIQTTTHAQNVSASLAAIELATCAKHRCLPSPYTGHHTRDEVIANKVSHQLEQLDAVQPKRVVIATFTSPSSDVAQLRHSRSLSALPVYDQALGLQDSNSSAIPVVPDPPAPSIVDGEPILQSGNPNFFSKASITISPTVGFINGKHEITLEPQSQDPNEAKGTQILTNVTTPRVIDEIITVSDYNLTKLPVDSTTEFRKEAITIPSSTEIAEIPIHETPLSRIHPNEFTTKVTTQTELTSNVTVAVDGMASSKNTQIIEAAQDVNVGMSDVTITSINLVVTATPAEQQVIKDIKEIQTTKPQETTTSVQHEVGESGKTLTYVKSDSRVTQTQEAMVQSPVTFPNEFDNARDKAKAKEEREGTSATPAATDSTLSALQTLYTPSSGDADGKQPGSTISDSQTSTQGVEEEKDSETPKEFNFSTSLYSTEKPSVSPEPQESVKTVSSSLYSTERPTSASSKTTEYQEEDHTKVQSTTRQASAIAISDETVSGSESFEEARSDITQTHHPHSDPSFKDVSPITTHPVFVSHEPRQIIESTTSLAGALTPTADSETVQYEDIDYSNPDYGATNLLEAVPQSNETVAPREAFITKPPSISQKPEGQPVDSVISNEKRLEGKATKSPEVAAAITFRPLTSSLVSVASISGLESDSKSTSEHMSPASTVKFIGVTDVSFTSMPLSAPTKSPSVLSIGTERGSDSSESVSMSSESMSGEGLTTKKPVISIMEKQPTDKTQAIFSVDTNTASKMESTSIDISSGKEEVVDKFEGAVSPQTYIHTVTHTKNTTMAQTQAGLAVAASSLATTQSSFSEEELGSDVITHPSRQLKFQVRYFIWPSLE